MRLKRLSSILCILLMLLLVLTPLCSWVCSMAGMDAVNPLSAEAVRWIFKHGPVSMVSVHLALLIMSLTALGAMQDAGLVASLRTQLPERHHRPFVYAVLAFLLAAFLLLFPVFLPHSSLLSVTGNLFPSPWLCGFPVGLCAALQLSAIIFFLASHSWQGWMVVPRLLSAGLIRYGLWVIDFMMASLFVSMLNYYF